MDYYYVSLSKGLFKRAIMGSGSALCTWSLARRNRDVTFATGISLGIITSNSTKLINQLKGVPARKLQRMSILAMGAVFALDPVNNLVFAPVIEEPGPEAVVTMPSHQSLKGGNFTRVPQLIGYNSHEALCFKELVKTFSMYLILYDIIPKRLVPYSMNVGKLSSPVVGVKIKKFYTKDRFRSLIFPNENFLTFLTDNKFIRPIQQMAKLTAKYLPVYMYRFNYNNGSEILGAAHNDELRYIFNTRHKVPDDNVAKYCMRMLFTNFAKYGDPTPGNMEACGGVKLKPTTSDDQYLNYINIGRNITVGENPEVRRMTFWRRLFNEYANPPFETY